MCAAGRGGVGGVAELQAWIEKDLKSKAACCLTLCLYYQKP